jgi:hypothetical protein
VSDIASVSEKGKICVPFDAQTGRIIGVITSEEQAAAISEGREPVDRPLTPEERAVIAKQFGAWNMRWMEPTRAPVVEPEAVDAGPPPSAGVIAETHDKLVRTTQKYRDQGHSLKQIIEIFSTAFPKLHYHPVRRAGVEIAFNSPKISEHPSEDQIALEFVSSVADYTRFVAVWGKWLVWRGAFWEAEETLQITDLVRGKCREMGARRKVVVAAAESLARSDRRVASHPDRWDSDPWLFNSTGGVFDLMSGEFRENRPTDYCSKIGGCGPAPEGSGCPLWLEFLRVIFEGDPELISYVQRVCGYCLTGSIREHALFFLFGTGGNGKSVFISTIAGILGSYHKSAPIREFHGKSLFRASYRTSAAAWGAISYGRRNRAGGRLGRKPNLRSDRR